MSGQEPTGFGGLLRQLRNDAGLTQEELAQAAGLSPRSISDLERGINQTARKDTARLLADALRLAGPARASFEAAARGRAEVAALTEQGTVARTLPRDIASFTGRANELKELLDAAREDMGSRAVIGIRAIGGMAGVGKTAFAVHAAHRLAPQFPDGQLFLPLHGHTPGRQPVSPAEGLASLLLMAGVPVAQIPPGLQARAALWRDRLATRRLLLVLDDAADSDQVRPLLPGAGESLVLVTSRRHLSALEDAKAVSLDTLRPNDAARLLARLADRTELDPRDRAIDEIAALCGYLPLAIGMLGRQLHHHPAWTAADLADELSAAQDRLELMNAESVSVAAAFDLSYEDLSPIQRQVFRRLSLSPGVEIDAWATAAVNGIDVATARRHLGALYDQYLLSEPALGRYRMHDLIREHSRALADREDPADDRDEAVNRLLDYYQHAAEAADRRLTRHTRATAPLPSPASPHELPDLADIARALRWARSERTNLLACLDYLASSGQHARVVSFTAAVAALLRHDGPWAEAIARHATAADSARHAGDRLGEANALNDLGVVQRLTGEYPSAARANERALEIYRDLDNKLGEANALANLGAVWQRTDTYQDAIRAYQEALDIYRDLGDQRGQACTLNDLGAARMLAMDNLGGRDAFQEALRISRELTDQLIEGNVLNHLGLAYKRTGDYPEAICTFEQALDIARELGDRLAQGTALNNLGTVRQRIDDYPGAIRAFEEALQISRDLGDRNGQAGMLANLGSARYQVADFPGATEALEEGLAIARELGYRIRQIGPLIGLGSVRRVTGDFPGATEVLQEVIGICQDLGERIGEAEAMKELGAVRRLAGDYPGAVRALQQALAICQETGDRLGHAEASKELAIVQRLTGNYTDAAESVAKAHAAYGELGNRFGTTETLNELGTLNRIRGDLAGSEAYHWQALDLARQIASPWAEAHALAGLGRCLLADDNALEAQTSLRQAWLIFQKIGAADAADVSAELDAVIL